MKRIDRMLLWAAFYGLVACGLLPLDAASVSETQVAGTVLAVEQQLFVEEAVQASASAIVALETAAAQTATAAVPVVILAEETICRNGPGTEYVAGESLQPNVSVLVLARSRNPDYVVITHPENGSQCWLWLRYAELSGVLDGLPLFDSPPTPTPTATPTPVFTWDGEWLIWVGPEPLTQYVMITTLSSNRLDGTFDAGGGNIVTLQGTVSDDQSYVAGIWTSAAGAAGRFEWERKKNEHQFVGNQDYGAAAWCGARPWASFPSPCEGP